MSKSRAYNVTVLRIKLDFGTIGGGAHCYVQEIPFRNGDFQTKRAKTILVKYMRARHVEALLDSFPRHKIEAALLRKDRMTKRQGNIRTAWMKTDAIFKETERYFNELSGLKLPNRPSTSGAIPHRSTKGKPCKAKS